MLFFSIILLAGGIYLIPYIFLLITFILSHKKTIFDQTKQTEDMPTISIVISTYNEEKNIDRKIENTLSLDYPKEKLEIIIVDSSQDETAKRARKWASLVPIIKLIKEPERRGLATALNLGYAAATGEIVVKSDCDILHPQNSLKKIIAPFYDSRIGAVSGKQILLNSPAIHTLSEEGYRSLKDKICEVQSRLDSTYMFEPFSAFRKELIEPISENSVADDAEVAINIRKKGFRTIFLYDAIFYETTSSSMSSLIQQKSRRGQGHIQLLLNDWKILFNPKYGAFGLIIFPTMFLLMIINPWLLILLSLGLSIIISKLIFINFFFLITILVILLLSYRMGHLSYFIGFLVSQISIIIGTISLLIRGPSYMWEKNSGRARR